MLACRTVQSMQLKRLSIFSGEHKNLKEYCERMKREYWPDWDECLANPNGGKPKIKFH